MEKATFKYSPLGKIFDKGLSEDDKKEGLLKKLKNIEDKNEQLLKIKNKTEIKEVTDFVKEPLSLEAKALIEEIRIIQNDVNYKKLTIKGVTMLSMILVILRHLMSYFETFITKNDNK